MLEMKGRPKSLLWHDGFSMKTANVAVQWRETGAGRKGLTENREATPRLHAQRRSVKGLSVWPD